MKQRLALIGIILQMILMVCVVISGNIPQEACKQAGVITPPLIFWLAGFVLSIVGSILVWKEKDLTRWFPLGWVCAYLIFFVFGKLCGFF